MLSVRSIAGMLGDLSLLSSRHIPAARMPLATYYPTLPVGIIGSCQPPIYWILKQSIKAGCSLALRHFTFNKRASLPF
jgi:hypothetical protein